MTTTKKFLHVLNCRERDLFYQLVILLLVALMHKFASYHVVYFPDFLLNKYVLAIDRHVSVFFLLLLYTQC